MTVIVTACNERRFLHDCLESIRTQDLEDIEIVVIDDASTDEGVDVAFSRFASDERFRFVARRVRGGLAGARNVGLSLARADLVTFVDGDDFLFPSALSSRVASLASSALDPGWTAGAYCGWMSVPEDAKFEATEPREVPPRARVDWLDVLDDAPFIASAPLLRTEVARSLQGFNEDLRSAEDYEFWSRLFRSGYVMEAVPYTGVAYRQKARSMFRTTAKIHATVTLDQYSRHRTPLADVDCHAGPFIHRESASEAQERVARARRLITALAGAIAAADSETTTWLLDELDRAWQPWMSNRLDVAALVRASCRRLESHRHDPQNVRSAQLERRVHASIEPLLDDRPAHSEDSPVTALPLPVDARVLVVRPRVRMEGPGLRAETDGAVVFLPAAAYHVVEFGPVAEELQRRGLRCVMMATERRWPMLEHQLRRFGVPAIEAVEPGSWIESLAGVVTLNDWGELPRDITVAANDLGVPTIGKVEGVQDFDDDDVHWTRRPYQTVQHVLCQGANDLKNVQSASKSIVGSVRLEAIRSEPERIPAEPRTVIVNLNFTYGVLEEARTSWLSSVVEACRSVGWPCLVSAHPAEKARPDGVVFTDEPISHLLTWGAVLVSRFSTVPFEAMARGVPFVYHNPHGEKVPTFKEPAGAFAITQTTAQLIEALAASESMQGGYREISDDFFRAQIDIDPAVSAVQRAADAIEARVRRR